MKNEKVRNLWSCLIIGMMVLLCAACDNGGDKKALDYIPVKSGTKWGYVDRKGKWLINPQFDNAGPFYDGRARIQNEREEYAFIDKSGKILNNAWYKDATNFSEGKAWVVAENSAPVLIDTEGRKLFEVKEALHVFPYSEGLATAYVKDEKTGETISGYLDTNGKWAIKPQYANAGAFSKGLAPVGRKNPETDNLEYGYIDKNGTLAIPYQFDYANEFEKNGTAIVSVKGRNGYTFGAIDCDGHYLITPQFSYLSVDGDGLQCCFPGKYLYGRCDKEGKVLINPQFEHLDNFYGEELAPAALDFDGKRGYVDKDGTFVINPQFDYASSFADGIAFVHVGEKLGFIDTHGKFLVNPQFDAVDISVVYAYHGINHHMDVAKSDFFDVAYIAERLWDEMKDGSVNGCSPGMTVGAILAKTGLGEGDVCGGGLATNLFYDDAWMSDVSLNLEMKGNYHDSVSDGWWDYVEVLNKDRRPTSLVCTVQITNEEKEDKQPLLFEAVRKAFGATKSNKVGRAGHTFELSSDSEGIHIEIKKIA